MRPADGRAPDQHDAYRPDQAQRRGCQRDADQAAEEIDERRCSHEHGYADQGENIGIGGLS